MAYSPAPLPTEPMSCRNLPSLSKSLNGPPLRCRTPIYWSVTRVNQALNMAESELSKRMMRQSSTNSLSGTSIVSFARAKSHTVSSFPPVSTVVILPSFVFSAFCFWVKMLQADKHPSNKTEERSRQVVFIQDLFKVVYYQQKYE